jgi:hypothetical protein
MHSIVALAFVLVVGSAACSDDDSGTTTEAPPASVSTSVADSDEPVTETTAAETVTSTGAETSMAAQTSVAPAALSGTRLVEGMDRVDVVGPPHEGAGDVPLFAWTPFAGAAQYDLVVLGPEGPIWAWRGAETEVWLGGLPFERPPGVWGPVIVDGSCWSVVALDDAGHAIAVSDFLAVSPGEAAGHQCIPGSGQ